MTHFIELPMLLQIDFLDSLDATLLAQQFFCVALSARMIQIWALVRALKNSQLTSGKIYVISGTGH
jgi:hypothetical protein